MRVRQHRMLCINNADIFPDNARIALAGRSPLGQLNMARFGSHSQIKHCHISLTDFAFRVGPFAHIRNDHIIFGTVKAVLEQVHNFCRVDFEDLKIGHVGAQGLGYLMSVGGRHLRDNNDLLTATSSIRGLKYTLFDLL